MLKVDYVYIGKIVNTHGIKGELRILSNFDKKEHVFKPNFKIYIGNKAVSVLIRNKSVTDPLDKLIKNLFGKHILFLITLIKKLCTSHFITLQSLFSELYTISLLSF